MPVSDLNGLLRTYDNALDPERDNTASSPSRRLIVTADDFGVSEPVNEAVERAHREGILSAASLMVTGAAAAAAVERARRLPRLGVGLHLVLVDGRPALPPERVPSLTGRDGRFPPSPLAAGIAIFCRPAARAELAAEMRAQFTAFRATGLALDHVNAHHHFHQHPTVRRQLFALAAEFGVRAIRIPDQPLDASWWRRPAGWGRAAQWLMERGRLGRLRAAARAAGIATNDHVFGLAESGRLDAPTLRRLIEALPDGVSEIYSHPWTRRWAAPDPPPSSYHGAAELAALVDPVVRQAAEAAGLRPIPFSDLA